MLTQRLEHRLVTAYNTDFFPIAPFTSQIYIWSTIIAEDQINEYTFGCATKQLFRAVPFY